MSDAVTECDPNNQAAAQTDGLALSNETCGQVVLVGAGPGDAGLITVAGLQALKQADVVIFDALANPSLLKHAREDAVKIDVGKRAKAHKLTQDGINQLRVDEAKKGGQHALVVRLKGGDPYLFGRGAEEAAFCARHGVTCRVIPGVTSGIAAPAYAGIPVTHRHVASTLTLVTGHEDPTKDTTQVDYPALAKMIGVGGTVCFYMGVSRLPLIIQTLLESGGLSQGEQTPVALVQWGTREKQRSVRGTMATIVNDVEAAGIGSPAIIVVGPAAGIDEPGLAWFTDRPLFGQKVLVTRTRQQASELTRLFEQAGAEVLEAPTIQLVEPDGWDQVDQAIAQLADGHFDWLLLTSANAVHTLKRRMNELSLDARALAGIKLAVIGEKTRLALLDLNLNADLVPQRAVAESLSGELIAQHAGQTQRFLLLQADIARPQLTDDLTKAGHQVTQVTAYETKVADGLPEEVIQAISKGQLDWITFTSASTVRNLLTLLAANESGDAATKLSGVKLASIGPVTSEALLEHGLEPTCQAEVAGVENLVKAVLDTL